MAKRALRVQVTAGQSHFPICPHIISVAAGPPVSGRLGRNCTVKMVDVIVEPSGKDQGHLRHICAPVGIVPT
jgi:hypothetical protein